MAEIAKSYYSLYTTVTSDGSSDAFNPFDSDNYTDNTYAATETKTSDISHSTSTGRITFSEAGTYLIIVNAYVSNAGSGADTCDILAKVNGTEISDVEPFQVQVQGGNRKKSATYHFMKALSANDYLEIFMDGTDDFKAEAGFGVVAMRARGKYGNLIYTVEPDDVVQGGSSATLKTSFDSDDGGTVVSTLDGVTFTSADGTLTPSVTTKYLMFSSLVYSMNNTGDSQCKVENRIYANGSQLVSTDAMGYQTNPNEASLGIVKELNASQTASRRVRHVNLTAENSRTTSEEKGSAFTIFDISDGAASSPQSPANIISISTSADSETFTTNDADFNIFDEDNHDGSLSKTDHLTAANIALDTATGRFTFSNSGDYFISLTCTLDGNSFNVNSTLKVVKNAAGSNTTIWQGVVGQNASSAPIVELGAHFITTISDNDTLDFIVNNPEGIYKTGTSLTMFNVDSATADDGGEADNNPVPNSSEGQSGNFPSEAFLIPSGLTQREAAKLASAYGRGSGFPEKSEPGGQSPGPKPNSGGNEWTQPETPPPPLFFNEKERDLVKQVNDELIERVVGQQVLYYPLDIVRTNYHNLYGEAIVKTFLPPIRVYAMVEWGGYQTEYGNDIGLDKTSKITVHFHKRRLTEDQDLFVREGDFVLYGDLLYEIVSLSEPRQLFGQVDYKMEITATCIKSREGLFDAT